MFSIFRLRIYVSSFLDFLFLYPVNEVLYKIKTNFISFKKSFRSIFLFKLFINESFVYCNYHKKNFFNTIPFTSLFGKNGNQFGRNKIQFGTNDIQFDTNKNQFGINDIQFGRNKNQFKRIMKLISCFLLAFFTFWHNFKKFSFLNSCNIYIYIILLVTNNINMYIYSDPTGDLIYIMET